MSISWRGILSACRSETQPDPRGCQRTRWRRPLQHTDGRTTRAGLTLIDCFGASDIGRCRERNEDQFLIANTDLPVPILQQPSEDDEAEAPDASDANLLLVADGMGGHVGGEQASRLAVQAVLEHLFGPRQRPRPQGADVGDPICDDLKATFVFAQQEVARQAAQCPELARMGTTLTLAYLDPPDLYTAHVGDSRAYLFRRQKLLQLTRDQTIAQMLVDAGIVEADCVANHPLRNALGSVLCSDPSQLIICIGKTRLLSGDQLLLCTDGLTRHVSDEQIVEILDASCTASVACRELIGTANASGGRDNITAVVARFGRHLGTVPDETAVLAELATAGSD
jgi:protein phosphatase